MNNITTKESIRTGSQLSIGQYVKYEPSGGSTTYQSILGHNWNSDQAINRETLNWRVLSVDENSINIISDINSTPVAYSGAGGYSNIVKDLNDMCETLYSHGDTKARSVNLEDFKGQPGVQQYTSSGSLNFSVPFIWIQEKDGGGTLGQSEQSSWVSGGTASASKYVTNYWYNSSGQITSSNPLYDSQKYFLSSRCVYPNSTNNAWYFGVQIWDRRSPILFLTILLLRRKYNYRPPTRNHSK